MEIFNLKKLNDFEIKEQYPFKISNWFTALENLDDNVDISRTWKILDYKNVSQTFRDNHRICERQN
jgi:hypothetical protein